MNILWFAVSSDTLLSELYWNSGQLRNIELLFRGLGHWTINVDCKSISGNKGQTTLSFWPLHLASWVIGLFKLLSSELVLVGWSLLGIFWLLASKWQFLREAMQLEEYGKTWSYLFLWWLVWKSKLKQFRLYDKRTPIEAQYPSPKPSVSQEYVKDDREDKERKILLHAPPG